MGGVGLDSGLDRDPPGVVDAMEEKWRGQRRLKFVCGLARTFPVTVVADDPDATKPQRHIRVRELVAG